MRLWVCAEARQICSVSRPQTPSPSMKGSPADCEENRFRVEQSLDQQADVEVSRVAVKGFIVRKKKTTKNS